MENEYYTLTTISKNGKRVRTVGVFKEHVDVRDILQHNCGDLNEAGYYDYAVIERLKFGLYPVAPAAWQFWWQYQKNTWTRIPSTPKSLADQLQQRGVRGVSCWASIG